MKKVNLGSGPNSAEGWINLDFGLLPLLGTLGLNGLLGEEYRGKWPKIWWRDIRWKLPFGDGEVDCVYCSHVLEHFEKDEAVAILGEVKRVLRVGGRVRVVLPDLEKMVTKYSLAKDFNDEYWGFDKSKFGGVWGKFKKFFIRPHRWMYDKVAAGELLKEAGFKKIKSSEFRTGNFPDVGILDLWVHQKLSLYLEAENRP